MVALRRIPLFSLLLVQGCSSSGSDKDGFLGGGGQGSDTAGVGSGLVGVEVLSPRDNASDIVVDNGQLFYSTQYDPAVFSWDPATGEEEKITWDWRDLEAFTVYGGRFFGSFSDSGIEGWVSELLPPKDEEELASQGSDGTLFRWPADLVVVGDVIWAVDEKLGLVWEIDSQTGGASTLVSAPGVLAVIVHEGRWIVGGENGVQDSTGTLDSRKAMALHSHDGKIWGVNREDGLYTVGGSSWPLSGPARPGPLAMYGNRVYVVDEVGGGVWAFELPNQ